jgi:glutamate racemase
LLRIETAVARRAAGLWTPMADEEPTLDIETSGDPALLNAWVTGVLGWQGLKVQAWPPHYQAGTASMR